MNAGLLKQKQATNTLLRAPLIALVGNPNTGKTTLFNGLCKSRQKTGNYPGSTVEKKLGQCSLPQGQASILDLPGLYSLQTSSPDEAITRDGLLGRLAGLERPDLLLFVLDGTNLRRNLFLFSQISELGLPVVVALTMHDHLIRSKTSLNTAELAEELGVPLIAVTSYQSRDIDRLKGVLNETLQTKPLPRAFRSDSVEEQQLFDSLHARLGSQNLLSLFETRQLLSLDQEWRLFARECNGNSKLQEEVEAARQSYHHLLQKNPALPSLSRYRWIDSILKRIEHRAKRQHSPNYQRWDAILTHRFFGLLIFGALMYLVFQSIYTWAEPAMLAIETGLNYISRGAGALLSQTPLLQSLVQDGIIAGVGSVLTFLPQIVILFFFIAILEDSGYLVRAAYLMDRLLSWSGLNGRSFIPLLSSFACAIPGILSTRVMPEHRVRLGTILIAPLMSCSARLPIYLLFIGAFIEPSFGAGIAALCLLSMHALGLVVALPLVWFFNWGLSRRLPDSSFVMEFPPYRKPRVYNVLLRVYGAAKKFTIKAGTIIFCFSIIIWALAYFPRPTPDKAALMAPAANTEAPVQTQLEHSYLGRMGKAVAPLFVPLGFDWKMTIGILGAFPAREVLISTLGVIYNVEDTSQENQGLRSRLHSETHADGRPVYSPLVALSLMIFFALCSQCMGTLAIIRKELGKWRWAVFVFVYMTGLAYVFSLLAYQGGRLLGWG